MSKGAKWFWTITALFVVIAAWPKFAILVGAGLIGWGEYARRRSRRSLAEWISKEEASRKGAIGTIVTGSVVAFLALVIASAAYMKEREQAAEQRKRDQAQAAAAEHEKKQREALLAKLPTNVAEWKKSLAEASTEAKSSGKLDDVETKVQAIEDAVNVVERKLGHRPKDLDAVVSEANKVRALLQARVELTEAIDKVDQGISQANELVSERQWAAADDTYATALEQIELIEGAQRDWRKNLVPATYKVQQKRKIVEGKRRQIAGPAASERKRLAREEEERRQKEQEAAAYAASCGEKPTWSQWDGELIGLESAIARTAHDPDSIDVENCTKPVMSDENCWISKCEVRGKNAFGARILNQVAVSYSKMQGFQWDNL